MTRPGSGDVSSAAVSTAGSEQVAPTSGSFSAGSTVLVSGRGSVDSSPTSAGGVGAAGSSTGSRNMRVPEIH